MRSVLIYTVHKAASMFLHRVTCEVSSRLEIPYCSVNGPPEVALAIKNSSWRTAIEKEREGACFGPIRAGNQEPLYPSGLEDYSLILHLRDPRDVLTSLYYSHTFSHPRKPGGFNVSDAERERWRKEGPDPFVLRWLPEYRRRFEDLIDNILERDNVKFLRYEDMLEELEEWMGSYLSAFHHIPIPQRSGWFRSPPNSWEALNRWLCRKYRKEFLIPKEDVYRHRRQIRPGDHLRKLQPATVETLNGELSKILARLGYEVV